jgi:EpsI family protein
VVGLGIARALAFPLAFLLFAVPFGEIFVPTLIEWTADFTVAALRVSGVPIYREANHFVIPSGAWSVVDACSGIRYLIASVMVGTIYAAVAYRSPRRRALFVAASIVVPIVANWLRAYLIVMIGHLSNNRLAVGVDHLIYGWVFFGVVMLLLFWVGSFWQEEAVPVNPAVPSAAPVARNGVKAGSPRAVYGAALAVVVAAGLWPPVAGLVGRAPLPGTPQLAAVAAEGGWTGAAGPLLPWKPFYHGQVAELQQSFRAGTRDVGLYLGYYRQQEKGRELITSGNLVTDRADWNWKLVGQGSEALAWNGRDVRADYADIAGPGVKLDVLRLYWIDGRVTGSDYAAKALLAWSKLTGRGDDAALIVLYTPRPTSDGGGKEALRDFAQRMSPAIERTLRAARGSV